MAFFRKKLLPLPSFVGLLGGLLAYPLFGSSLADLLWGASTAYALFPLFLELFKALRRGTFGIDLLALLSLGGCLALREFLAGSIISVMYTGGQALEAYAGDRATRSLSALAERAPRFGHREEKGGLITIPVSEIRRGDRLTVKTGEIVPTDGFLETTGILDESVLTGESLPVAKSPGDKVRSGTLNTGQPFTFLATLEAKEATYSIILNLVRSAQESKAPLTRIADRVAIYFIPITLLLALFSFLLSRDLIRSLAVIVVATPCPLLLAAPIAFIAGIGRLASRGIIVKDTSSLETLAKVKTLLIDKTGTLTAGSAVLEEVALSPTSSFKEGELLSLAASIEELSTHPLAEATVHGAKDRNLTLLLPTLTKETPGFGIEGTVGDRKVSVGKLDFLSEDPPSWARRLRRRGASDGRTAVFIQIDGVLEGALLFSDELRPETARTLRSLRSLGISRQILLTGDRPEIAEIFAATLNLDVVLAERTPEEKLQVVREEKISSKVLMVGDGINDAPALAAADVGIALSTRGATGSTASADIVLAVDQLDRLIDAIRLSRRSRSIALQSIFVGMGLSIIAMIFAAFGYLPPVFGALLQEAIDVAIIINALRALTGGLPASRFPKSLKALGIEFHQEHERLLPGIENLRSLADSLEKLPRAEVLERLNQGYLFLEQELLPHEKREEQSFYPVLAKYLGGDDPTGVVLQLHADISRRIHLYGRLLKDLGSEGPTTEDLPDLRRLLYGLHAVLRLHFTQEESAYFEASPPVGIGTVAV